MRPCHLTAVLIPSVALAAALQALSGVAYSPAESAKDVQSWTVEHSLELADISLEISNGERGNIPEIDMRTTRTRSLTIAQVHVAASDGMPIVLERTFSDIDDALEGSFAIESEGFDETLDASVASSLDDVAVRFRWDADDESWGRAFMDDDGEETDGEDELIEGLAVDAHLGGLLSGLDDAEEGARWEAAPSVLLALVAPGGHLGADIECVPDESRGFEPIAAGLDPLLGMDLFHLLGAEAEGSVEGEISCALTKLGDEKAVIALRVDVTATRDVIERVEEWPEVIQENVPIDVLRADATITFSGEGEVTWDVESGLPTDVTLELDLVYSLERDAEIVPPGGEEIGITTEITLEGSLTSVMTAE